MLEHEVDVVRSMSFKKASKPELEYNLDQSLREVDHAYQIMTGEPLTQRRR